MKRGSMFIFLLIILILFINIISASFEVGNLSHSITTKYYPGDFIKGWINISLSNEPVNSLFETRFDDNVEDSKSVIYLLKLNNANYDCIPTDCETAYVEVANSGGITKSFELNSGESKIFGFKFTGSDITINSISFTVASDAPSSCSNQLEIDFFNNGEIDIKNNKTLTDICDFSKSYGCFDASKGSLVEGDITTTPYCQRIELGEFPGFRLGAWVKEQTAGDKKLNMSIYDGGDKKTTCELPKAQITTDGSEIFCDVDYLVKESKDYYVCISSTTGTGIYTIKGYSDPNGCGFSGEPIQSEVASYNISVIGKRFNNFGTLIISNEMPNFFSEDLNALVQNYISNEYGTNCPTNGCIVPIRFVAKRGQTIELSNLIINYNKAGFSGINEINFYNVSETSATVSSDFQKIYLDKANFSVPDKFGNVTFSLKLNGQEIFSEEISIESISPKQAANIALGKKLFYFANLKSQIESLPLFYQTSIKSILNLSLIESKLIEIQRKNSTAISDQDYLNITEELIKLEFFPQAIATTAKADSIPFYPAKENINLEILKEIGGGNYSARNKNKYIDAILVWNFENLETKIDFERISAINEDSESSLLNVFNIKIEKKNLSSNPYLIIRKLENLRFKESYSSEEVYGYVYIPITDSEMTITFSTTEEIDFINIPAFISPKISELSIEGFILSEKSKKWIIRFVIALAIILFMGFILYIILQEWYKRKYENYLFKNRNYLYNLATYIQNSKKSGIEDKEILSKLKKAGWKSEQIKYVMRKYYGKRTGMFEIPIKKIFGVFKKKEKFERGNFYQQYK